MAERPQKVRDKIAASQRDRWAAQKRAQEQQRRTLEVTETTVAEFERFLAEPR